MSTGAHAIAESLVRLGVTHVFGIVGIPVIEVADACIAKGIKFISFRNEQAATYAASAFGYLTGLPGVALVVGGPGVIHALAGIDNAKANCFPMLLLAGSSESHQRGMGAFQELNQVSAVSPYTKFAGQPAGLESLPFMLEKAYRTAYFGRPGATYVDLPADIIQTKTNVSPLPSWSYSASSALPCPRAMGDPDRVRAVAEVLRRAKHPLLIVGKGAAYARAEKAVRQFQNQTNIPFLPSPMGKGVIPDSHPLNVSSARSAALKSADVILMAGARLNWIFHYGQPPKFRPDVKIIQIDIAAEEIGSNGADASLGIVGDVGLVLTQLAQELDRSSTYPWKSHHLSPEILKSKEANEKKAVAKESLTSSTSAPLKYEAVYAVIRMVLNDQKRKVIYVSEGANTMDISRSSFGLEHPRTRLDAGTNATMGVGLGYAIAAKAAEPASLVVAIEGDSAFGFSGMEVETAVRSNLPMIIYVMNNGGVYHGVDEEEYKDGNKPLPSTALSQSTRYDLMAESLGAKGYNVQTAREIRDATVDAIRSNKVCVINVIIDTGKDKKLEFGWMASTKKAAKL